MKMDIYASGYFGEEQEKQFEAIEAALGFKLFAWQKAYIVTGKFRKYGATTAEILRDLMQVESYPLDFTKRPTNAAAALYRDVLREIKQQLDDAGVPTREVFFNQKQKRAYMENPENQRKERERYQEARREGIPARLWR
ncbi:MAG: hypothetical protein OSJ69_06225 [Acetatifactor sp.]|nr:hypothetical protein [Acetatifactor sp.]